LAFQSCEKYIRTPLGTGVQPLNSKDIKLKQPMVLLGHKSTRYLYLYVQLAKVYLGGARDYVCKEAIDLQTEIKLIKQGFEYVRTTNDGISLYRKAKY
jgi:hypothetical protein